MTKLLLSVLGLIISIFFHKTLLTYGVQMGLSFTLSMIIPYIIEFFFIASITFQLYSKLLAEKALLIRRIFGLAALLGGCAIAFAFNPIYDGDFNHEYREISLKGNSESVFKPGLTMLALPGCPHCYSRLEEMKLISKIHPEINMHVLVINEDTLAMEDYQLVAGKDIDVGFFPNSIIPLLQVQGFPSIYYTSADSDKPIINWTNSGFGSAAWDYVIKQEKK